MNLTKKILVWFGIATCLGTPLIFWSLATFILLFDDPTLFESDFQGTLIVILILGAGGILGIVSLLSATLGRSKLLFNKFTTKIFLLMGVFAVLICGYLMITPYDGFRLYEMPLIVLTYIPLICVGCIVYVFRNILF